MATAITSAYATEDEYMAAGYPGGDGLTDHLDAMSRLIERETGQFFGKDAAVVNRIYTGNGSRCLPVDNIASSTGVVIKVDTDLDGVFTDEDAWAATDYQLRPLNRDKGPEPRPWYEIFIPSWSTKTHFPLNYPVQVTAIFGWPAVPASVKAACIEMTAIWRADSSRATNRIQEIEQVGSASPYALSLLKRLRSAYRVPVVG